MSSVRLVPLSTSSLVFLNESTLDISFRVWHEGKSYECGDIGHRNFVCPQKTQDREESGPSGDGVEMQAKSSRSVEQSETAGGQGADQTTAGANASNRGEQTREEQVDGE